MIGFFSFTPRVSALRWAAWLVTTVALLWLCAFGIARVEGTALVALYAVLAAGIAKLATESVRRLHDCGQSGRRGIGPAIGVIALVVTALMHWMGYGADKVFWGALMLAAIGMVTLFLRPGVAAANRYGPVPGWLRPNRQPVAATGTIVAVVFIAAGIAFGAAVLQWQAAMRQQTEDRMRRMDNDVAPPDLLASQPG